LHKSTRRPVTESDSYRVFGHSLQVSTTRLHRGMMM